MASSGSTVLVVGSAGATGLEVARSLIAKGYDVIGTVRDRLEASYVRHELPAIARVVEVDLAEADQVGPLLSPVLSEVGDQLSGVIICAAICPFGPLEIEPLGKLRLTIEVNAIADLAIYQSCLPSLRESKGRLIVLSSFGGKLALPFIGHYVVSKFALEALADVMRREASRWGVHVIVVEPGGIRSTMVSNMISKISGDIQSLSPKIADLYGEQYREYRGMMESSYEVTAPPELIATEVIKAFQDPYPCPRYTAGDDARVLVERVRTSTDQELDEFVHESYLSWKNADKERHPNDYPA